MKQILSFLIFSLSSISLLSGCASTPQQVLNAGKHYLYTSKKSPDDAADCLARASKNVQAALTPDVRKGDTKGSYEVTVASTTGDGGTYAVQKISPIKNGSTIDVYLTNNVIFFQGNQGFADKLVKSCL